MNESEDPKPKGITADRIKYAAENINDLDDFELREIYNQILRKKMQKRIKRKARILRTKDRYGAWTDKREAKKDKKQKLKAEIQKVKERLNGE